MAGRRSFEIDPKTGQLLPTSASSFAAGSAPEFLRVDASGKFLFVANNNSNDVSAFQIDGTTGALTPVPGSPFPAGSQPKGVALVSHANLDILFVANEQHPFGIALDPKGNFLYVANKVDNTISGFSVNATTGMPLPLANSPFPAGGSGPIDIVIVPGH